MQLQLQLNQDFTIDSLQHALHRNSSKETEETTNERKIHLPNQSNFHLTFAIYTLPPSGNINIWNL